MAIMNACNENIYTCNVLTILQRAKHVILLIQDNSVAYLNGIKPKGAVSFQLKTVICDLWENAKSYDLAICRDNSVYQTIFNGTTIN
jgi:hypothetical protein